MTRYYSIDEANAAVPEVERILIALRDQREELINLRDRVVAASPPDDETPPPPAAEQIRLLRLGMQGLIDQMQAGVARLVELDVTLRDIATGLIDFPALVTGRPVWLCFRLGESAVEHWHPHDEGFDSRRPLAELPTGLGRSSGTPAA
ncbi:MAG TPA: DUF2203 domain-containing protein [Candidatus Limnocylindrales bacterium]|nr:DUF2203 domain-containing protein [Candidatus Limnocylindrales bacterium]